MSLNATTFNSSYIKSEIYGGRINRYFFKSKLQLELNYRTIKYTYPGNEFSIDQKAYGFNISYNIMKMMMINFNRTNLNDMKIYLNSDCEKKNKKIKF